MLSLFRPSFEVVKEGRIFHIIQAQSWTSFKFPNKLFLKISQIDLWFQDG
jgi:hypothetical protein